MTHTESLDSIGSKRNLLSRVQARKLRRWKLLQPKLVDLCHGQDPNDESAWLVVMAFVSKAQDGEPQLFLEFEQYVKQDGQWRYRSSPSSIANQGPFAEFFERYYDEKAQKEFLSSFPDAYEYRFNFRQLAPRRSAKQVPWLVDQWPQAEEFVYMEDVLGVGGEKGMAQLDAHQSSSEESLMAFMEAWKDPKEEASAWYYRHGRFRYS